MFWRVLVVAVNIHRIREVIPWFKSSFQLRMDDKKRPRFREPRADQVRGC
jgi:two-component system LytT family response regulator/two-component system response regulator LytT